MSCSRHISVLLLLLPLLLLAACSDQRMRNAFCESDEIHLMVGGDIPFTYDPNTCQLAFSRERKEFRAHTDNMSDFYMLRLDEMPDRVGQSVNGVASWTTGDDLHSKKTAFEALKFEGGKIWLWSSSSRIAVVVQTLD